MSPPISQAASDGLASSSNGGDKAPGIALFFILEHALDAGMKDTILELLEDQGHEILFSAVLERTQIAAAGQALERISSERLAASEKVVAAVTLDLLPMARDDRYRGDFPDLDNPKILKALERAAYLFESLSPVSGASDPLVSTSNTTQAWRVIRILFASRESELRTAAQRMRGEFTTEGAIRILTREGRRAKVELVSHDGGLAIRKTYRSAAFRYMHREIEVLERLAPIRPELPKLLGRGDNFILLEYVVGGRDLQLEHRGGRPTPLPLGVLRALADFIKACVREGFDPIDIRAPGNVMMTDSGLKVIDFELWRHCPPGTRPEQAVCLTGVQAGDVERPRGVRAFSKPYSVAWYPLTLLSVRSFLYDPMSVQRLKRGANFLRVWGVRAARLVIRRS